MPEAGSVSIQIFNAMGQKIDEIYDGHLDAGEKRVLWKPTGLSGGVYFVTIITPWGSKTTKALLLK
jgi:hypothetical protein